MIKMVIVTTLLAACTAGALSYGQPGYYLTLYPSSEAMASGGGSAALVDNSDALYINPAGIGKAKFMEAGVSFAKLPTGLNYYPAAFCAPLGKFGSIGIAMVGALSPEAPEIDDFGIKRGTYSAGNNAVSLGYGRSISKAATVGAALRIATANVGEYSGIGVGFDVGAQVVPLSFIAFGASLGNLLGPSITLDAAEEVYPVTFTGAIGVKPFEPFTDKYQLQTLTVSLDGQVLDLFTDKSEFEGGEVEYAKRWRCGISYDLLPYVTIRTGANDRTVNAGFGISVKGITADYGFGYHYGIEDMSLGYSHCFGIRYEFGKPLSKQEQDVENKERDLDAKEKMTLARRFFIDGNLPESRRLATGYLAIFPGDKEATSFLKEVDSRLSRGNVSVMVAKAEEAFKNGDIKDAERFLDKALSLVPSDTAASRLRQKIVLKNEVAVRLARVHVLYEKNSLDEAARELDALCSIDSTDEEVKKVKKKMEPFVKKRDADRFVAAATKYYYDAHDVELANSELLKALELSPDHADARALYDKISKEVKELYLKKVGKMADNQNLAADDKNLKKLLELDAQDRILNVRTLIDDKQFGQAIAEAEALLREAPGDTLLQNLKSKATEFLHRQEAEREYNEALKLFNEGDFAKAEERVDKASALSGGDDAISRLKTDIKKRLKAGNIAQVKSLVAAGGNGNLKVAKRLTHEYLAVDSGSVEALGLLKDIDVDLLIIEADNAIEAGNYKIADQTLQDALRASPDNRKVQEAFKNLKEAMEALE